MSEFEEGDPNSKICLLGEAPSHVEIAERRPFVGPAGGLLEQTLHAAQIARSEVYIVNVFEEQCHRKGDKPSLFNSRDEVIWTPQKGLTERGLEMSAACRERISACKANVLVPMGGPALSLATDKRGIMNWRGSILASPDGRKVVPTVHPSAALRGKYEWRYLIAADLRRVKIESEFPEIVLPQRTILIKPSFDEALAFLEQAMTQPEVATDIEVSRGNVSCFSISWHPQYTMSIPIVGEGYQPYFSEVEETEIWAAYASLLAHPAIAKVNQNVVFDLAVLLQLNHIVPQGLLHDPMIAHSVMNPALDKDLGTLCSLYTREPFYKADNCLDGNYQIVDFEQHWRYNALDAAIALECHQVLQPILDKDGYRSTYDRTIAILPSLIHMMVSGFKVNVPELRATRTRVAAEIATLVERIGVALDRPILTEVPKGVKRQRAAKEARAININSPKQLMGYFYDELKIKPYTMHGKPTIDDKALARLVRSHKVEAARLIQTYRGLTKMLSTYYDVGLDEDERLRSSFNPRGTWSGRLSSSETVFHTGLNFQNLEPRFREFMIAG